MNNELIDNLNNINETLNDYRNKRSANKEGWIKHILTLLTGLLSVLVAFNSNDEFTNSSHLLFSCTLVSLGLCIFSGVVYLHHTIDLLNQKIKFHEVGLSKRMTGDLSLISDVIKTKLIYQVFRYLFYLSSFASLVFLILYGIF